METQDWKIIESQIERSRIRRFPWKRIFKDLMMC